MHKKQKGFTLIEVAIAIAIVAITAIIAIQLFTSQARKGRRIDAINALLAISLAEERYRSNNSQYGTLAQVYNSVTTSTEGYYTLAISNVSGTSYTVTATGVGDQANDIEGSTACSPISLAVSNGTTTKSPSTCWPS